MTLHDYSDARWAFEIHSKHIYEQNLSFSLNKISQQRKAGFFSVLNNCVKIREKFCFEFFFEPFFSL